MLSVYKLNVNSDEFKSSKRARVSKRVKSKRYDGLSHECKIGSHARCIKQRCPCPCGHR